MARKSANVPIKDDNRDNGKLFVINEMPSSQGEAWAIRAILALMRANVDIPEGFENFGMAALVELGIKCLSQLKWEDAEPLLDEMMACVNIIPDPAKTHVSRPLIESDIEEIPTRLTLRKEWWTLHVGFLQAVAPSIYEQNRGAAAAGRPQRTKTSRS